MTKTSKLIAAVAVATFFASPAFAQSFDPSIGTGNIVSSYYDHGGGLHVGAGQQPRNNEQIAVRRNGLNAFASVPNTASGLDNPALNGGGSIGYDESLRTNAW
jgi:hypothetical protein